MTVQVPASPLSSLDKRQLFPFIITSLKPNIFEKTAKKVHPECNISPPLYV